MNNIIIDDCVHLFLKGNEFATLSSYDGFKFKSQIDLRNRELNDASHLISWGELAPNGYMSSTMETGFFSDAAHIDKNGLYQFSSLNLNGIRDIISNYTPPVEFSEFRHLIQPKFKQPTPQREWEHVVLACQAPADRSILRVGSTNMYYQYLKDACVYYGDKLFLKLHPTNSLEIERLIREIAAPYKCTVDRSNFSIIDNCEFVTTYNSTIVADAILRHVRVNQHAPGYFWKSGTVNYCNWTLQSYSVVRESEYLDKFCTFLVWKYCSHIKQPIAEWIEIFKVYADSKEDFPLPEKYSYANYILNSPPNCIK
jgi:hypothetical protein